MVLETSKAFHEELDAQADKDCEVLKKKPFDRDDDPPRKEITLPIRKTTVQEGYRQSFCGSKTCKQCPRRTECFGQSMTRRTVERHVRQDYLDAADAFGKTSMSKQIHLWHKQTIERSFVEAKDNHDLRYVRILEIRNIRDQAFLIAAV